MRGYRWPCPYHSAGSADVSLADHLPAITWMDSGDPVWPSLPVGNPLRDRVAAMQVKWRLGAVARWLGGAEVVQDPSPPRCKQWRTRLISARSPGAMRPETSVARTTAFVFIFVCSQVKKGETDAWLIGEVLQHACGKDLWAGMRALATAAHAAWPSVDAAAVFEPLPPALGNPAKPWHTQGKAKGM